MTQKMIQSIPVVRASSRDYELAALVGDDAVILGWTMDDAIDRSDLLGFAIKRTRRDVSTRVESECRWLPNDRRFSPSGTDGDTEATTQSDPLQQFYFLDYAVEPGNVYTYSVQPVRGTPALRYYETPIAVTVNPRAFQPSTRRSPETDTSDSVVMPCPQASDHHRLVTPPDLGSLVSSLCDGARSAVFLYSVNPLPKAVLDVIRHVNSGRLLYGLVPGRSEEMVDVRRAHNTVHLSRPAAGQQLSPIAAALPRDAGITRYTSALVTDPWSRSPNILLWSENPGLTPERVIETRIIGRDKRVAARLAVNIFQAYTAGRLPQPGRSLPDGARRLEPDGRWSNIYFSRHAASHKFREREIFSGHP